ncbi:MAG: tRNA (adenosine(37)-N6)-threonylcarbamoyltransferase complex ATPase subunit type 1 TsaE [Candidatus Binatia bacterium]|nr:tRNA (adenosine(37)-N6)-threonylcarbamoyltransferase complex ATPase subunit type 1 TsaE [Candidatus Binatia bacterium]MDG1960386.1 tRNA (adenosine(37)-N6)-threonylcarbamoyltransferase complex ATPase subunit type 1 TsaE [Candidatus Binatia bacterium]MDG2008253.1 tRNA (adenosine(37)-N6)-threonylcarbamoyltransferase complex ATPase subunit type 1 TsaE [Candidatus Binatia bacterium]
MRLVTRSEQETESLGETLASILQPGAIVGLTGPLGAGKTAFVRGIARGCGVAEGVVHSPTFLTAAEYEGRPNVTHLDLYRHEEMLPDADWLAEILDGDGIAVVEWFERLAAERPPESLEVSMAYGDSDDMRVLEFRATGARAEQVLGDFASRRAS